MLLKGCTKRLAALGESRPWWVLFLACLPKRIFPACGSALRYVSLYCMCRLCPRPGRHECGDATAAARRGEPRVLLGFLHKHRCENGLATGVGLPRWDVTRPCLPFWQDRREIFIFSSFSVLSPGGRRSVSIFMTKYSQRRWNPSEHLRA